MKPQSVALVVKHETSVGRAYHREWNLSQKRSSLSMKPQSAALIAENETSVRSARRSAWNLSRQRLSLRMKPQSAALVAQHETSVGSARGKAWNLSRQRLSLRKKPQSAALVADHETSVGNACRWPWNLRWQPLSLTVKPQSAALVAENETSNGSACRWPWNLNWQRSSLSIKPQSLRPNRIRANKWRICLPQYTSTAFLMTTKFTTCPHKADREKLAVPSVNTWYFCKPWLICNKFKTKSSNYPVNKKCGIYDCNKLSRLLKLRYRYGWFPNKLKTNLEVTKNFRS
jgi:hypothetical protein